MLNLSSNRSKARKENKNVVIEYSDIELASDLKTEPAKAK